MMVFFRIGLGFAYALLLGIIGLWVENGSGDPFDKVNTLMEPIPMKLMDMLFVFGLLINIVVILGMHFYARLNEKNQEIKDLQNQLKEAGKELLIQFKDYVAFKDQHGIHHAMKQFVERESFVIATQMYSFFVKNRMTKTQFKIAHREGYVAEGEDINAIIQEYTEIPRFIIRRFERAMIEFRNNYPQRLLGFIRYYIRQLSGLAQADIEMRHVWIHSLLILAVQKMFYRDTPFQSIQIPALSHLDFRSHRRTGVLRSILDMYGTGKLLRNLSEADQEQEFNLFIHEGAEQGHNKAGRIYLAKFAPTKHGNHILLIVINPDILEEEGISLDTFRDMASTFRTILQENNVELAYNTNTPTSSATS